MTRVQTRIGALVALAVVVTAPGPVHADAAGPTDYRSEVVAVDPATDTIALSIEGGDAFVRLVVEPGHEAIVLGYHDEQYLRIDREGNVDQNRRSFATYYNADRFGTDDIPETVDNSAAPDWEQIGDGGSWAWHDHRAHWMLDDPPIGLEPGQSLPTQFVPVVVDGQLVEIEVRTTLQENPSVWPAVFGLLIGLQLVLVAIALGQASMTLVAGLLSIAALVVGLGQYLSLPAETGPLVTWWLLPAIALASAVTTVAIYGRSTLVQHGLVALSGVQLLVWAVRRRSTLTAPVLPTDLAFWFDRCVTAAVLVGSAGLVLGVVRGLVRPTPS